ncbi:hypothetical protein F4778DRAFT_779760 [Xylariomycetidae sp. FL2044]|nr:hypothetical protein F4778DRAFT_779760 [Xylariomycetidae sp. FL2044]
MLEPIIVTAVNSTLERLPVCRTVEGASSPVFCDYYYPLPPQSSRVVGDAYSVTMSPARRALIGWQSFFGVVVTIAFRLLWMYGPYDSYTGTSNMHAMQLQSTNKSPYQATSQKGEPITIREWLASDKDYGYGEKSYAYEQNQSEQERKRA